MRPTSGSRTSGCIYTARWIPQGRPSTSFFQPGATPWPPSAFRAKALGGAHHPHPRVINTDKDAAYPPAIVRLKAEGALEEDCQHRPVQYLNNVLEQDHRAIKRRVRASQHFRSFWGAWRTIAGYEAIHMIRKRQACQSAPGGTAVLRTASSWVCSRRPSQICDHPPQSSDRLQSCNISFEITKDSPNGFLDFAIRRHFNAV